MVGGNGSNGSTTILDSTILVALSAIAARQTLAMEETREAAMQVLDYVASHPNAGITYRKSDMILAAHADAGYLNEPEARSRVGAIFFLSENDDCLLYTSDAADE